MDLSHLIPLLFPDKEPIRIARRLVNDLRSPIKRAFEPSDLIIALKPHFVLDLLVNFVTDIKITLNDENNHIDVLKLSVNYLAFAQFYWLKQLKKENHEVHVIIMLPPEVSVLHFTLQVWECKKFYEFLQKFFKQKF